MKKNYDECGCYIDVEIFGVLQRFRWIPPGDFLMGSPECEPYRDEDEGPQHQVFLTDGFLLADTACTQELWQAVMVNNPSKFTDNKKNPVENVSWYDCQRILAELNEKVEVAGWLFCLPTEAQWEYACRSWTRTPFWWGGKLTPELANYDGKYPYTGDDVGISRKKTVPVKSFRQNQWGLWQMHGNVWEWCSDGNREYRGMIETNPMGRQSDKDSFDRILRGGSWHDTGRSLRSAYRLYRNPNRRILNSGFRLALKQTG